MNPDLSLARKPEEWQGFLPSSEFEFPILKTPADFALLQPHQ